MDVLPVFVVGLRSTQSARALCRDSCCCHVTEAVSNFVVSGYEDHINNKFEPPEKVKRALVVVVVVVAAAAVVVVMKIMIVVVSVVVVLV